ncbi:PREDICTED: probable N-acetyltransferase CML3 [Nanorana parkeri]|uniref:probable N-acetyltransferase CML3 n=1 Tax=Nanorana parkeri TaxID=125878 RepID=UPI0008541181|nr:PREDICTED: probable N-acetyltransferase CML3 [Nanorana parkeri]
MSQFTIRLYKDSDYHVVRSLFAVNIMEHVNRAFRHALQLPHIYLPLLCLLLLPVLSTTLITASICALALIIVCLWLGAQYTFRSSVQNAFSDDLLDIQKYYLERENHCFWVLEMSGKVVGTVAAIPSSSPGGKNHLEIKRLSVSKSHRRKGIAKALVRATVDFARMRGCTAVIALTTSAQVDALRLYEKLGFRLMNAFHRPMPFRKLLDLKSMFYQYDIPQNQ